MKIDSKALDLIKEISGYCPYLEGVKSNKITATELDCKSVQFLKWVMAYDRNIYEEFLKEELKNIE